MGMAFSISAGLDTIRYDTVRNDSKRHRVSLSFFRSLSLWWLWYGMMFGFGFGFSKGRYTMILLYYYISAKKWAVAVAFEIRSHGIPYFTHTTRSTTTNLRFGDYNFFYITNPYLIEKKNKHNQKANRTNIPTKTKRERESYWIEYLYRNDDWTKPSHSFFFGMSFGFRLLRVVSVSTTTTSRESRKQLQTLSLVPWWIPDPKQNKNKEKNWKRLACISRYNNYPSIVHSLPCSL